MNTFKESIEIIQEMQEHFKKRPDATFKIILDMLKKALEILEKLGILEEWTKIMDEKYGKI
ncbi:hypothetical protein LCGC14_0923350 [marine sediment metagenome]|uniref:Uncharacterized protein n=1 Tax=marine sediment metagenome TaxID=412755 RepID=A0A0F9NQ80_9ZZZZ